MVCPTQAFRIYRNKGAREVSFLFRLSLSLLWLKQSGLFNLSFTSNFYHSAFVNMSVRILKKSHYDLAAFCRNLHWACGCTVHKYFSVAIRELTFFFFRPEENDDSTDEVQSHHNQRSNHVGPFLYGRQSIHVNGHTCTDSLRSACNTKLNTTT